ncbi:hypothetical protein [Rhodococcus erythropolis]|uniref:hypothetical protein n=1 Tax=Rhodococcus erythropolis TaxID=1833 RepID=UPI001EDCF804|nr:hypothetical protein [Rhodococcus erythropolis]UKO89768.1 hypothetical protein ITJ47_32290 [Rhodococcus erythropolis]
MTTAMTSASDVGRTSVQRRSPLHLPRTPLGATWTWWRQVTIDLVLVIAVAGILGGVGSVLAGPLTGVAFAVVAAAAFRVILQTINT